MGENQLAVATESLKSLATLLKELGPKPQSPEQPVEQPSQKQPHHAVVAGSMAKSFPVQKVTIVPRGQAGGYTLYLPEEDSLRYTTVSQFEARLVSALGGRLAEEIVFGPSEVTTAHRATSPMSHGSRARWSRAMA